MTRRPRPTSTLAVAAAVILAAGLVSACADTSQGRTALRSTHVTSGGGSTGSGDDGAGGPPTTLDRLDRPDFPDGYEADVVADLVAGGFGTAENPPRVELSNFEHSLTVSLPTDTDPDQAAPLCERASAYAFGSRTPAGTVALVTVKADAFEPELAAQRAEGEANCRTSDFTYGFVNEQLQAEHADAPWIERVNGSSQTGVGDDVRYTVSVVAATTPDEAVAICAAAAEYVFSARAGRRASHLDVIADPVDTSGQTPGEGRTLARTDSADGCTAA